MKNRTTSVFTLTLLLVFISLLSSGCVEYLRGVEGNGNVVKQDRTAGSFADLKVGGAFEIFLRQGDQETLTIEADENLLEIITTEIRGNTLIIDTREPVKGCRKMAAYITFREMESLDLSGAVNVHSEGQLRFNDLFIGASGASEITIDCTAEDIEMDVSGASEMLLAGTARSLIMELSGASEISAFDLQVAVVELNASGASDVEVFVTDEMNIDASGASTIHYKGNPKSINQSSSGSSTIRKVD